MYIGVSTACLYPMHTEDALSELIKLGVRDVEIFFNATEEICEPFLSRLCGAVKENGVRVHSVHPFTSAVETLYLFSDYDRRTEEMLDIYRRYFEAMNRLGAGIFVLHGALENSKCTDETYFERYARLYAIGKEFGVTVAQENISYCKSKSADFLRKMRLHFGKECAFVLDLKQAHRCGADPFEIAQAMGDRICHCHVSDWADKDHDCLPAGKGRFDFARLGSDLSEMGFSGAFIVELYRRNFGKIDELRESVNFLTGSLGKFCKIT